MVSEKQLKKRKLVAHATATGLPGRVQHQASTSSSSSSRGRGRGRGGFRVGPTHAPAGSYLGKAKKIKEELIRNAKTKKAYYQTLKREGLPVPERPASKKGRKSGDEEGGAGSDPFFADENEDGPSADEIDFSDEDDDEDDEEEEEEEAAAGPSHGRLESTGAGQEGEDDDDEGEEDAEDGETEDIASRAIVDPLGVLEQVKQRRVDERVQQRQKKRKRPQGDESEVPKKLKRESVDASTKTATRRADASVVMHQHYSSETTVAQPQRPKSGQNKKGPSKAAVPATSMKSVEEIREERERKRKEWNRPSGSARGRARGQPDLGARVGVMLETIEAKALGLGAGPGARSNDPKNAETLRDNERRVEEGEGRIVRSSGRG
ncbi:hypothetical protein OC861_005411 [Tilletia horrida]|nr:hypothetical protein OC861_005411 [Tilletia horrida]